MDYERDVAEIALEAMIEDPVSALFALYADMKINKHYPTGFNRSYSSDTGLLSEICPVTDEYDNIFKSIINDAQSDNSILQSFSDAFLEYIGKEENYNVFNMYCEMNILRSQLAEYLGKDERVILDDNINEFGFPEAYALNAKFAERCRNAPAEYGFIKIFLGSMISEN